MAVFFFVLNDRAEMVHRSARSILLACHFLNLNYRAARRKTTAAVKLLAGILPSACDSFYHWCTTLWTYYYGVICRFGIILDFRLNIFVLCFK